jgi:predicted HAD superfamily phosphohydrolase YqeG
MFSLYIFSEVLSVISQQSAKIKLHLLTIRTQPMLKSQYRMLATDFDDTIATNRVITPSAEKALLQAKEAGFLLSIVTGRELNNLITN